MLAKYFYTALQILLYVPNTKDKLEKEETELAWETQDDRVPFTKQYVAMAILVLNVLMFFLQIADPDGDMLIELAFVPAEFFSGEGILTIFTSMFMHAGVTHIFFNMLFFYVVADDTENALGHGFFLLTYLASGVFATFLHATIALFAPTSLDIPLVGASGAIAGLIAVYGILFPKRQLNVLLGYFFVRVSARKYVIIFTFMQLAYGLLLWGASSTAYFAHLGGLVAGALFALLYKSTRKSESALYQY